LPHWIPFLSTFPLTYYNLHEEDPNGL
jgi:hypothetical protein